MVSTSSATPTSCSGILLAILCCLLAGHLHTNCDAAGTATLQKFVCSGNYTTADAYATNLNKLLAMLPDSTVASTNGGFFNGTVGQPGSPGTAYALAMCYADFTLADCRDCLAMATSNSSGMVKKCPGSSTVLAMYDQCLVHYSDAADLVGTAYTDIVYTSRSTSTVSLRKDYSDKLKQGLVYLNAQAASLPERWAMSKASPFALVQCTWDLSPDKCKACLDKLAPNVSDFSTLTAEAEAKTYSCRVRQSNSSFAIVALGRDTNSTTFITNPAEAESSKKNMRMVIAVVVSVGAVVAALAVAVAVVLIRRGRQRRRGGSLSLGDTSVQIDLVQEYTYEELKKATGGFSKEAELGRGAFGVVYKGTMPSGKVIAVKKLQRVEKVDKEQFLNEVSILSGLKHKNLVKLEGFCVHNLQGQQQEGLLCYEYLPDGSLEDRLHGGKHALLNWAERLHILRGICRGLQYLHDESPNDISIVHMDLKADNILLQEPNAGNKDFLRLLTPKIADFGISRNLNTDKPHEYVAQIVGNVNIMPREFIEKGKASAKVDIYSFGLIILEMVTGKSRKTWSSTEAANLYGEGFIKQVREHFERKEVIEKLKDPSLQDRSCHDQILKCVHIALDCVHKDPAVRPDIATITRRLADISNDNKEQKP